MRLTTIHSAKGPEFPLAILMAPDRLPNVRLREEVADSNLIDVGRTRALGRLVVTWGRRSDFTDRFLRSSKAVASTGEGSRPGQRTWPSQCPRGGRGPPRGLPGHDDGALDHDHALAVPVGTRRAGLRPRRPARPRALGRATK